MSNHKNGTWLPIRGAQPTPTPREPNLADCVDTHIARQIEDLDVWFFDILKNLRVSAKWALVLALILVR